MQADGEELRDLGSLAQSKQKAIAEDQELLKLDEERLSQLRAELSIKELGKLSKTEVQEQKELSKRIGQIQVTHSLAAYACC